MIPPATLRRAPLALATVLFGAVAVAGACTDVPTGTAPVAISLQLPAPAVARGDTLRDSTGAVAPLHAFVYNSSSDTIPDAAVRYYVLDAGTAIAVDSVTGLVTADTTSGIVDSARVIAVVGGLQTATLVIHAVPAPDSVRALDLAPDTIRYTGAGARDSSRSLRVQLLHRAPAGSADTVVARWIVRYQLTRADAQRTPIAPLDTLLYLADDAGRRSRADTTDASGIAGRRVRVDLRRLQDPTYSDSVIVSATVRARAGTPLPGETTLVWTVYIRPGSAGTTP